jgi:cyclic-di-AMP phosphodiesterase PgpH
MKLRWRLPFELQIRSTNARPRRRTEPRRRPPPAPRIAPVRLLLALGTVVVLSLLLCIHLIPNRVAVTLGSLAQSDVTAQRTARYEDTEATRRLRDEAVAAVEKRYQLIPDAKRNAQEAVKTVFDAIANPIRGHAELSDIRTQSGLSLAQPTVDTLSTTAPEGFQKAREVADKLVTRAMEAPLHDDEANDLRQARRALLADPVLLELPENLRAPVAQVCSEALSDNHHFDARATQQAKDEAESSVLRQTRRIAAGELILRKGERVTQAHLDALTALGLRNEALDTTAVLVIVLMVGLIVVFMIAYLRLFHRELYEDTMRLFLLAILAVVSVMGIKLGSTLLGLPFTGVNLSYLGMMCVASAGMVIGLLLSPSVATLVVALLAVTSGVVLNNELRFTVFTLGSSLAGIVSVASMRNRSDVFRAGLAVCGANAVLSLLVAQIEHDLPREMWTGVLMGIGSGLVALALFYLGVWCLERPFGITTHLRLLELSDPATPILQDFRMAVPGTYAHSLMVGNLAHAAAEAIGADAMLVRVASYYHDLGKMNRPEFFIENQSNAENVHDRISPSLSALVLVNHVKEGLEIAERVGLPPRVREVISQHHGTTLMKYFYHQATGGVPDPTLESQFRYPGPKPQSKEAAILMLADGVEAASRVLNKPTPQRVFEFVARMIEDKRADGQLDDCPLTLRDLKTIQDVFTRTLCATLHARIEYPTAAKEIKEPKDTKDTKEPHASGDPRPEPASEPDPTLGTGRRRRTKTPLGMP